MVVVVDVILDAIARSATNVIKWATLRGNAKKMPIDATDATVIYLHFYRFERDNNWFFVVVVANSLNCLFSELSQVLGTLHVTAANHQMIHAATTATKPVI